MDVLQVANGEDNIKKGGGVNTNGELLKLHEHII